MKRGFLETEQTSLKLNIWIGKRWRRFLRVWQRWNRWGPEEKMPNVEIGIVSAAEERVVDVVPVVQEDGAGDLDDEGKKVVHYD